MADPFRIVATKADAVRGEAGEADQKAGQADARPARSFSFVRYPSGHNDAATRNKKGKDMTYRSMMMAAAAAIEGHFTDIRDWKFR